MTDMEHKPNGWNLPINQMTDDEWTDYFECRKNMILNCLTKKEKQYLMKHINILKIEKNLLK